MLLLRGSTTSTDDQSLQFGCWLFGNDPLKSHEANQKIFIGRGGGDQHDFFLKPTRLTPAIDFGHAKEELKKFGVNPRGGAPLMLLAKKRSSSH